MRVLSTIAILALGLLVASPTPTQRVEGWIEVGGPLVIFVLLFSCGLGLPLPEDVPLIIGGFFVAQGKMHPVPVCILAWCGIVGGDCVLYHLGKRYGLNITRVPFIGKHLTKERILKAERLFDRYGIWVVAIGRLVAFIRAAMVVAAGAIRFNFIKFVIADGLAALVSGGLFIWLGYFLGRKLGSVEEIHQKIKPVEHWVIAGIILVVAMFVLFKWRQARREKATEFPEIPLGQDPARDGVPPTKPVTD
jgi:membrane protein DedA with SNARE-associated domain